MNWFLYDRELRHGRVKALLTFSWRGPLLYKNQSIDLLRKSMYWFLYDNGLRHERVEDIEKVH